MRKRNKELMDKILHVRPAIGNKYSWDSNFEDLQKIEKKISRATLNVFKVPKEL